MASLKKSFGILIAIIATLVFSVIGVYIFQNIALSSNLNINKFHYLQSLLHLNFAKEYLQNLDYNSINFEEIELFDDKYIINIKVVTTQNSKVAHIFVSPKDDTKIKVYDKVMILNNHFE